MSELLAELISGLLEVVLNVVFEGLGEFGFIGWRFMLPVLVSIGAILWTECHSSGSSDCLPPLLTMIGGGILGLAWEWAGARKQE